MESSLLTSICKKQQTNLLVLNEYKNNNEQRKKKEAVLTSGAVGGRGRGRGAAGLDAALLGAAAGPSLGRGSEERRVGKEC